MIISIPYRTISNLAILLFSIGLIYIFGTVASVSLLVPVFVVVTIFLHIKRKPFYLLLTTLLAVNTGSEAVMFVFSALLIFLTLIDNIISLARKPSLKVNLYALVFITLGLFGYFFGQLFEINLMSYPFYLLLLLLPMGTYFYFKKYNLSLEERKDFLVLFYWMCAIQCFVAFFDFVLPNGVVNVLLRNVSPDHVVGTFAKTRQITIVCLLSLFMSYSFMSFDRNFFRIMISGFIMLIVVLSSARYYFAVMIMAFGIIFSVLDPFIKYKYKILSRSLVVIFGLTIGSVVYMNFDKIYDGFLSLYVVGQNNKKIQYYQRAMNPDNRNTIQYLFGTGPGTIGSRSSNFRAYDTLAKGDDDKMGASAPPFLPAFSSVWTRKYLADLWDDDYAFTGSTRSALLGNPFNTIATVIFEFGVIGFLVFSSFFLYVVVRSLKYINLERLEHHDRKILLGIIILSISVYGFCFGDQIIDRPFNVMLYGIFLALGLGIEKDLKADIKKIP